MKLGLVRRGYSGTGGAESYVRRFAAAAAAAGHECVLFASPEWKDAPWEGKKILVEGTSPRQFADALREQKPKEHCDFLFSFERVWECDAYRAGDGVHAAWLQQRSRYEPWWKPFVRSFQRKHHEILSLERALFTGGAKRIIANSKMVRREIAEHYGTPGHRIEVVYNGVPAVPDDPEWRLRQRKEFGLGERDFALLFAGSGWERKGLLFAIHAVNRLPGARLFVAGKGSKRSLPRSRQVEFLGPQDALGMQALFGAADLFVLPTIYEPFSNACLEAMAAGMPVITTARNGFSEILRVADGEILNEPSDVEGIAKAIASWSDPARRMGAHASLKARAAQFSVEANLTRTLEVILGGSASAKSPAMD